jgi:shikimate dehydrogenase
MISGTTQLLGLIGWPVHHSFSPTMHNSAAADLGLDLVYVALPVHPNDLGEAVPGLAALGFRGVNVTVPHKETVIPLLDKVDPAVQAIGAVNTITIEQGESGRSVLTGYNTDWSGFLANVQSQNLVIQDRDCLVLGAGGSARAVAYALAVTGGRVHLFARRIEQAQRLVVEIAPHTPQGQLLAHHWSELEDVSGVISAVSLIVNTTPLGMSPNVETTPWPDDLVFPAGAFVYDLVYNPAETTFVKQAQKAGCQAMTGLGMLLNQGAQAFQLWTGSKPDRQVMAKAIGQLAD